MTVLQSRGSVTGAGRRAGWTTGRIISAVIGLLLALCSLGLLGAGGVALWASTTQRHGGDIDMGTWSYRSPGYAVVSSTAELYGATGSLPAPRSLLGSVRIRVTPAPGASPVFAGIAPAARPAVTFAGSATTPSAMSPTTPGLHRAHRRRPADRARPGRHLGHPGGRAWHPDPDLAGPQWPLDGGGDGRRRVTAGQRAHQRRRTAAITALDRCCPAGRRRPRPGRRTGFQRRSRAPRSQPPRLSPRPVTQGQRPRRPLPQTRAEVMGHNHRPWLGLRPACFQLSVRIAAYRQESRHLPVPMLGRARGVALHVGSGHPDSAGRGDRHRHQAAKPLRENRPVFARDVGSRA